MPTDLLNSSESLELFIRRENLESPLVRSELNSGKQYEQAVSRIVREMQEGRRKLDIDVISIPVDAHPGRRVAVQLLTEIVNRTRELQDSDLSDRSWYDLLRDLESSSVTPFYPKEPSLMMAYFAHVEYWGNRIEFNDESIFSETTGLIRIESSIRSMTGSYLYLLTTSYFNRCPYREHDLSRLIESANESHENRIAIMKHLYQSYRYLVEHTPDIILYRGRVRTSRKRCVISLIDEMTAGGSNPFDVLRSTDG
jgi:hypothetical protein